MTPTSTPQAEDVLHFWFEELAPAQHFARDDAVDQQIAQRFAAVWESARRCELWGWRASARGRLAEILVLDQFSRNLHRDSPLAFAQDPLALALAQELVAGGQHQELAPPLRAFAYLPYMHSESLPIHAQALELFERSGLEENLRFERAHLDILERFGRYPHRNAVLGRVSTPAELAFLAEPGSSF